jgi:hypothetical protein
MKMLYPYIKATDELGNEYVFGTNKEEAIAGVPLSVCAAYLRFINAYPVQGPRYSERKPRGRLET